MPVDKTTIVRFVRAVAKNAEEKTRLLLLVISKPELWNGLEEDKDIDVLGAELRKETTGVGARRELNLEARSFAGIRALTQYISKINTWFPLNNTFNRPATTPDIPYGLPLRGRLSDLEWGWSRIKHQLSLNKQNSPGRQMQKMLVCPGGSGIGKFKIFDALLDYTHLKLQELRANSAETDTILAADAGVFIDLNLNHLMAEDAVLEPDCMLGVRLLAEGLFGACIQTLRAEEAWGFKYSCGAAVQPFPGS